MLYYSTRPRRSRRIPTPLCARKTARALRREGHDVPGLIDAPLVRDRKLVQGFLRGEKMREGAAKREAKLHLTRGWPFGDAAVKGNIDDVTIEGEVQS